MADNNGILAALLSGQDPLAGQIVPGYQSAQLQGAALNPDFGHNEGPFGALAKTLAGFGAGGLQPAVQNVVNQRVAAQPELARLLASPDPYAALAANPNAYSPIARAALTNATPEQVAQTRELGARAAFLGAQANLANQAGTPMPPLYGPSGGPTSGAGAPVPGTGRYRPSATSAGASGLDPQLDPAFDAAGQMFNVDPAHLKAIAMTESGGKAGAVSPQGAQGLMQLMPDTAKQMGVKDVNDPVQSIFGGAKYYAEGLAKYGNPTQALMYYHGGPDQSQWGDKTQAYPATVAGNFAKLQQPARMAQNTATPALAGTDALAAVGRPQQVAQASPQQAPQSATSFQGQSPINQQAIEWAQNQARMNAALQRQTPPFITDLSRMGPGMPESPEYVQQKAAAQARGETQGKPQILRQGGSLWSQNPQTGQWELQAQSPVLPSGTELTPTPGGPIAKEVPGANQAIQNASRATHLGQAEAELGGVPGVNLGATAQPGGAAPPATQAASQPIQTQRGTTLPALSEQALPQSPEELRNELPEWRKTTQEWTNAIAPARQAEMRLATIAQAFKLTETGAYETNKAQLGALLKSLGMDTNMLTSANPAAVQEALHDNILTTLPLLKAATPRPSQTEFMAVSENREHPNLQPEANLRMLTEDLALVRQAQQLPLDWNDAFRAGWRNPDSFLANWNGLNPLEKTRDQIEKEIGPLKGMQGFQPPAAQPQYKEGNTATNPLTGEKLIFKGGSWVKP